MRNFLKGASFLVAAGVSTNANALTNTEIMQKLFTSIAETVSVGKNEAQAGETFLVLANPGMFIDPTIDLNEMADRRDFFTVLDRILIPDWLYSTRSQRLFELYGDILRYGEGPIIELTAAQKKRLSQAKSLIYDKSDSSKFSSKFLKYRTTRRALRVAVKAVNDYKQACKCTEVDEILLDDLEIAREDFDLIGGKVKIRNALTDLDKLESLDPTTYWTNLRKRYTDNLESLGGTDFPSYIFYPSYSVWHDKSRAWASFSVSESDLESTKTTSHTKVGGGVKAGWGLFGGKANYSEEKKKFTEEIEVSNFSINAELLRVEIERPYFDSRLFYSNDWQLVKEGYPYKEKLVSDGANATATDPSKVKTPKGLFPFIPTGLLLARNTTITGTWSKDFSDYFERVVTGSVKAGWGPFSVSGNYYNRETKTYVKADASDNGISIKDAQIIGFFVEVLPKSPDPLDSWEFPSDELPEDELLKFAKEEVEDLDNSLLDSALNLLDSSERKAVEQ